MALNLNSIMLGSEDSKKLADFYAKVLGAPNPDWSDEANTTGPDVWTRFFDLRRCQPGVAGDQAFLLDLAL